MGARAFRIDDADPKIIRKFFENLWNGGVTPIQTPNMQDGTKRRGRTIDKYDVTGSNCTTHSAEGLKFAGSKVFEHGYTPTTTPLPIDIEEDFTIPVSLQRYLESKSADFSSMLVVEMTNTFKQQYPNTEKNSPLPQSDPEQHAQAAKKQNSFADTCKPEDNPLLNGVYLWTETTSAGHAFVSVHENNSIYLYTYGRYGRTDKSTFTEDGILDFFQDEDARKYYRYELYEMGARAFRIDDADSKRTRKFFENLWIGVS